MTAAELIAIAQERGAHFEITPEGNLAVSPRGAMKDYREDLRENVKALAAAVPFEYCGKWVKIRCPGMKPDTFILAADNADYDGPLPILRAREARQFVGKGVYPVSLARRREPLALLLETMTVFGSSEVVTAEEIEKENERAWRERAFGPGMGLVNQETERVYR